MLDDMPDPNDRVAMLLRHLRRAVAVARAPGLDETAQESALAQPYRLLSSMVPGRAQTIDALSKVPPIVPVLAQALTGMAAEHPSRFAEIVGLLADLGLGEATGLLADARARSSTAPANDYARDFMAGAVWGDRVVAEARAARVCPTTEAVTYTLDDLAAMAPAAPDIKIGDYVEVADADIAAPPDMTDDQMKALWQQALRDTLAAQGHQITPSQSAVMMADWCQRVAELADVDDVVVGTIKGEHTCIPGESEPPGA